ncbi:paraneoplastic antigen Ma1 homolog [Erpetoichthys calabaricus]|uniref:paraneoplastic antigen Ma1 homolog n=1 Tax=Erpetoichthys calabaricus TaxID=27687 RepID=UPI00223426D7|nr:paraneoplastic antigen Ma1 homolog [Erpetoichthys calabaricus]
MAEKTELVSELKKWCRGEGLSEAHGLLVIVPEDVEIAHIEEILGTIKCLGRVRVRGRIFNMELNSLMVLCECKNALTAESVPPEVHLPEGREAWSLVIMDRAPAADENFHTKLKLLMQAEGKTMEDIKALLPGAQKSTSSADSVIQAFGDLLEKTNRPSTEGGYRHLRIFSGTQPVPAGEEQFDHWLEQAWLMVEESQYTVKEKKRRVMERLKGPALEIAKAVRTSDPDANPTKYLEALESAFGTAESGDDLYFAFRLMQQQTREKLSDFLRRLERSLSKVVHRGGLLHTNMDRARLEQLLRGAVAADLMLIQLRLRERKTEPPTILQLLSEIRAEEEYEASRRKLTAFVHPVQPNLTTDLKQRFKA